MSLLPDPQVLRAIATRIALQAEATRVRGHSVDTARARVTWHGRAATSFQTFAGALGPALRTTAHDLDRAAAALRSHADAVEAILGALRREGVDLARSGSDVVHLLRDGADPTSLLTRPGALIHDGAHLVRDGANLVRDGSRLGGDAVDGVVGGARHGAKVLISAVGL